MVDNCSWVDLPCLLPAVRSYQPIVTAVYRPIPENVGKVGVCEDVVPPPGHGTDLICHLVHEYKTRHVLETTKVIK